MFGASEIIRAWPLFTPDVWGQRNNSSLAPFFEVFISGFVDFVGRVKCRRDI